MPKVSSEDARRITGVEKPLCSTVSGSLYNFAAELSRGESVAITAFDNIGTPISWFFIGKTAD